MTTFPGEKCYFVRNIDKRGHTGIHANKTLWRDTTRKDANGSNCVQLKRVFQCHEQTRGNRYHRRIHTHKTQRGLTYIAHDQQCTQTQRNTSSKVRKKAYGFCALRKEEVEWLTHTSATHPTPPSDTHPQKLKVGSHT